MSKYVSAAQVDDALDTIWMLAGQLMNAADDLSRKVIDLKLADAWARYQHVLKAKALHDQRAHTKRRFCQFVRSYTTIDLRGAL